MSTLIVYESMFGATHAVAEEIASGIRRRNDVTVVSVHDLDPEQVPEADLIVLGAPTHVHGLSTPVSRENAALVGLDSYSGLQLEHDQNPIGMAEWLERAQLPADAGFAVFDTRIRGPRLLVGSAAHHVASLLHTRGIDLVAPPTSFFVMDNHRLEPGERERASAWGAELGLPQPKPFDAVLDPTPATPASLVVGHDGSAQADDALTTALDLAAALSAPVMIVRAWSIDTAPRGALFHDGYASPFSEVDARVRELLIEETRAIRERHPGVAVEFQGVLGQPAEVLIEVSRRARMLVVGSRGRGGFAALMLGSVSEQCVRHAACPVLVVRPSGRDLDDERS
ncbi:universal stress protein [Herbiconiux ginsengi]|uniref:Nucleotide-binding universal stress protein, UspA family n=1 Tax=Herbiconiux ginsengi TaxID=381665 RepID=A0A1H3SYC6_9MICO|nr:universal stress protein [Herbiconiux ginsengi]SDZ42638.1 Nucleotide-binding universal stress protein, UspA family [Herbiconiux ginsengi]